MQAQPAQAPSPETALIRNVRLIDRSGEAGDVLVSLLIKKGKLDLGQPPSFLILDRDPREDLDALLDTKTHARFAMRLGDIVKNDLPTISAPSARSTSPLPGSTHSSPPQMRSTRGSTRKRC